MTREGNDGKRCEVFDEANLDAALARFDELSRPAQRPENTASQAYKRLQARFEIRDWAAIAEMLAHDHYSDDRRRVINAGTFRGRDAEIASMRAAADLGVTSLTSVVIATRGDRLALCRTRGATSGAESFDTEVLRIVEIDATERLVARVVFDLEEIDAAFEELDARYLAGEAAAHAHTWSVITHAYSALNRHEIPLTAPETVDHRRLAVIEAGHLIGSLDATCGLMPDAGIYVESVHRLADFGAVVTHVAHGTAEGGLNAEWRAIDVQKVAEDRISHCEIFDETDLDAALARFDELSKTRLENTASRAYERIAACIADDDWDALAEALADDFRSNDRRPVVGAGIQDGRDALIADLRVTAELGIRNVSSTVVATRGERLVLVRARYSRSDQEPGAFLTEVLNLFETNADGRTAAALVYTYDALDAALEELDVRYLAGEAAAHAHTWSIITGSFAAVNRHELPELTPDWVNIDHRRAVAFAPGDMTAYIRATLDDTPDFRVYLEAVHRLSDLGAVVTWVSSGTSRAGFQAEWREINIATVEGDLINRSEMFDEADLDTAIARFDGLHQQVPRLGNAASRVIERFQECFAARDWDAMAEILADSVSAEDRRPVVRAGTRRGRDAYAGDWQKFAEVGFTNITSAVIATRGERLVLSRHRVSRGDPQPRAFVVEVLAVAEIDGDDQVTAIIAFGPDDIDAAFTELDTRYLAGEAADQAHTWSVIARAHAAINRHELPPTTPDWVNIDRRRGRASAPGDMTENIRVAWDLTPDLCFYIEAVHRLTNFGAVITSATRGTSDEGFDAEWKQIDLLAVEGDRISRAEIFDEVDIGKALKRFDELHSTAPRLENAATRAWQHLIETYNRRDVAGVLAVLSTDGQLEDRRKGLRALMVGQERQKAFRELFIAPDGWRLSADPIAIRGSRLCLSHDCSRDMGEAGQPITVELVTVMEISDDGSVHDTVSFDLDDIDAAFAEIDARYLAGEAAPHAQTWSAISGAYAALNRGELLATTPDWINVDHRQIGRVELETNDLPAYLRATWDLTPELSVEIEAVHRLDDLGAVVTHTARGTSTEGVDAEWRLIELLTVEGDRISRCEIFDETDLDAALARFDELSPPAPKDLPAGRSSNPRPPD